MSSNLRTVAQIPARIKYLVAVAGTADCSNNLTADTCYAFTCSAGTFSESLISNVGLPTVSILNLNPGDLFKDLGRQVTIYDSGADKDHLVTYRQVQPVNGAGTEGVSGAYTTATFVRVWAASGAGVRVARTGPGAH